MNLGIGRDDTNNLNPFSTSYYQSGQVLGQFVYSRYTDAGLTNPLYSEAKDSRYLIPDYGPTSTFVQGSTSTDVYGSRTPWVWDLNTPAPIGGYAAGLSAGNGYLTRFCVHVQHPQLNNRTTATTLGLLQFPEVEVDVNSGAPQAPEAVPAFLHSSYFNDVAPTQLSSYIPQQLTYKKNDLSITAPYSSQYFPTSFDEMPSKFGFISDDRYLIGSNTVGSYLFLGTSQFNQLLVDGVDAKAEKLLDPGEKNALLIPVVFQYRMTDYYGTWIANIASAAVGGQGILGGYDPLRNTTLRNLSYSKKIGIDIYQQDEPVFSFDVQVSAVYKKDNIAQLDALANPTVAQEVENITFTKDAIRTLGGY